MADDPAPAGIVLGLIEVGRVLGALEGALLVLVEERRAPGLQDELDTVISLIYRKLGLAPGGAEWVTNSTKMYCDLLRSRAAWGLRPGS